MKVERPVHTYDALCEARNNLRDQEWLAAFLYPHCKMKTIGRRGSRLRLIQYPWEFARFLILLAEHGVRSYMEIGTSTGGSFLMVDSYLRAAVPGYERSVGFDHRDKMRDFAEYRERFPTCQFKCENSSKIDVSSEHFDAAFIDARHIEHWVLKDFQKVQQAKPKVVGFHDIRLANSTVCLAWNRIKASYPKHIEIVDPSIPAHLQWGIGAVILDNA